MFRVILETLVVWPDLRVDPASLRREHHVDERRSFRQFGIDGRREWVKDVWVLGTEHPKRGGALRAKMPLSGADAAPAWTVIELRVKHGSFTMDFQRVLVGVKVDCIATASSGLAAN
jgi:hypothetical protein